ncbi:MAG: hypothetical protein H8E94_00260 [Alphaproteobacteria bacterium]|nr:hypothetical protein [Alphaproteobacteria bacterium]
MARADIKKMKALVSAIMGHFLIVPSLFLFVSGAIAESKKEMACPGRIAQFENNLVASTIGPIVHDIYKRLGCNTEFIP